MIRDAQIYVTPPHFLSEVGFFGFQNYTNTGLSVTSALYIVFIGFHNTKIFIIERNRSPSSLGSTPPTSMHFAAGLDSSVHPAGRYPNGSFAHFRVKKKLPKIVTPHSW